MSQDQDDANERKETGEGSGDIEQYLEKRAQITSFLQGKFTKVLTVMYVLIPRGLPRGSSLTGVKCISLWDYIVALKSFSAPALHAFACIPAPDADLHV
mgnify:FL=1